MASSGAKLRCAIYTRKSTEEGLDQAFNSLDAQREACAAYVLSQQHEGWTLLPDLYDDGGYSGGSMERPALQQLLADVKAGRIDVVVVYKIDRLTRALTDFARIIDVFDAADCSFVSVTQAFSTTSSMGRLTLNILLSFAQFEREVIAERVRDKVAASRARGMWMGGAVPLGYRVEDRRLIVVPEEAERVRYVMERYLACSSVRELLAELERDGIVSKRRTARDGSIRGGVPFRRGALYWLLSNPTYVGKVRHKDRVYPGEHKAIVAEELFDAVQAKMAERTNPRSPSPSRKVVSLLAGMIHDHRGRPMSPTHTRNHGRRYRYYVSNMAQDADAPALRLPAGELDASVRKALASFLCDTDRTRELVAASDAHELASVVKHCRRLSEDVAAAPVPELHATLKALEFTITVRPDGVTASFCSAALLRQAAINSRGALRISLAISTHQASFGHEPRLRLDPQPGVPDPTDQRLLEVIARSFAARDQLLAMSEDDLEAMPVNQRRHLQRIARLAYLDPAIVRAILDGTHTSNLSARTLWRRGGSLPLSFAAQQHVLQAAAA